VWDEPREPGEYPIGPARFPETWPRTYPGHQNYWYRYTLNDDLLADLIPTLFLAEDVYGDARFGQAAAKAADFLLLAQLPEPQPGWAQQYDFQMQPIWARKFEPPAVSGGETQGVLRVLMQVYRRTGNPKYLKPIPPALDWLKRSRLPDGRLARFYELQTNRPLYFTREYVLTHDDSDLPTHYGFKVPSRIEAIEREYQQLAASPRGRPQSGSPVRPSPGDASIRKIVASQDNRGAWVTDDGLRYHKYTGPVINMQVAVDNLNDLADYLAAVKVK
jgi:hypothetical protein